MKTAQPYSAKTVFWLIGVGVLSFAAAAYFMIYAESNPGASKANAFSYSAIGHKAFVETLRELDIPVLVSRADSAYKASDQSLLVVAEPRLSTWYEDTIGAAIEPETVLLVLPKWDGFRDPYRDHWLGLAGMLPADFIELILREVAPGGTIQRALPREWNTGPYEIEPEIEFPQFMKSGMLTPVISTDQGILLGVVSIGNQTVWVLSDPDILSNYGLGRGENARLAVSLIETLRPADGAVIFDETVHGYFQPPSLWRALFQIPFIVPVILAFFAILVVGWSSMGRFGAPLPAHRDTVAGKAVLIDNTASLLRFGGHAAAIVRRYADTVLRDVAHRLNAPRRLEEAELIEWVDRVGKSRGVKRNFRELQNMADSLDRGSGRDAPRIARLARRLYQWKQEIMNGS